MTTSLTYGKATTCLVDTADATHLRPKSTAVISTDQIAAEVRAQLAKPNGYPPLSQVTIPDDRVVLAIEPGIPQLLAALDGAMQALRDAGVENEFVTILLASPHMSSESIASELAEQGHRDYQIKVHDPDNEKEIAFLGVSQAGLALRLNRELCEADLVLPITVTAGQIRPNGALPSSTGLLPFFSDRETIERVAAATAEQYPAFSAETLSEIEECGRQLGVGIAVQLVPGSDDQVAAVFAGEAAGVAQQAQAKYREVWNSSVETRANLVIATLTGEAEQQTWQNLGRALAAAEAVLEPGGSIAICSELTDRPGRALSQLFGDEDALVVEREILRNPSSDSGPAMQLCRSLQRGAIYLRSKLDTSVVEGLGMTPLESDSELERLAQSLRPCVVLEEAQWLLPTVTEAEA